MHSEKKERCEEFGEYLVLHGATVREAARYFGMSKSTVHKDVTTALRYKNPALADEVAALLGRNKAQRHLRGGEATRKRYAEERERRRLVGEKTVKRSGEKTVKRSGEKAVKRGCGNAVAHDGGKLVGGSKEKSLGRSNNKSLGQSSEKKIRKDSGASVGRGGAKKGGGRRG